VAQAHASDGNQSIHGVSGFGRVESLQFGSRPARILVVSDEHSVRAMQRRLQSFGAQVQALVMARDVVTAAKRQASDLILLDLAMPRLDGTRTIGALRKDPGTHGIPVVVVSASDDIEGRIESLDEGATDCVARPLSHAELVARIRAILRARTREELLRRRVTFLERLATSDPLTSLSNRRAFDDRLHLEMERAARDDEPLSCLIVDIDWFKSVNDRFGHQVGDDVLRQIAKIMLDGRGEHDAQCRYGGEEFVWLLPGAGRERVLQRAEWLRRNVEDTEIPTAEGVFRITISIGASTYELRQHGRASAEGMLEQADAALLEAKKLGRNRVVFREPVPDTQNESSAGRAVGENPDIAVGGEATRHIAASRALAQAWESWARDAKLQEELRILLHSSIKVLTEALAAKDPETMTHCHRVASTGVAIGMELALPPHEIDRIKLASLIHDIGKMAVPEAILQKPAPLSAAEWELIKKHPARGAAMLQDAQSFRHLIELVLHHQESYDGSGYPDGLAGNAIPIGARIIRVADAFDAMTSERPYRPRKSLEEATRELRQMAGATLDPVVVETLLRLLATMTPMERELIMRRDRDLLIDPEPARAAVSGAE
jgi:diguanylate cyclase (GGDEF)-like protein